MDNTDKKAGTGPAPVAGPNSDHAKATDELTDVQLQGVVGGAYEAYVKIEGTKQGQNKSPAPTTSTGGGTSSGQGSSGSW
jgi:hypothetical protein